MLGSTVLRGGLALCENTGSCLITSSISRRIGVSADRMLAPKTRDCKAFDGQCSDGREKGQKYVSLDLR